MAAELVGGAFLSSALQVLFHKLASREVLGLFRRRKLDSGLLKKLKMRLLSLDSVIRDAEWKQMRDASVEAWLAELKHAVYDSEDVLNDVEIQASPNQSETGSEPRLTSDQPMIQDLESRLSELLERLEDLVNQIDLLGLRRGANQVPFCRLPTTSLVIESQVRGRQSDKEAIIKLLSSNDNIQGRNKIRVVTIVGIGGVGKTTLAQLVYNDNSVYFDVKAWVSVSEVFDVAKITKTILEALGDQELAPSQGLDQLQVKLKDRLNEKKFLLVLDDVWNEKYDDWEFLSLPLNAGAQESTIVVTTRSEGVASIMGTVPSYHLKGFDESDGWSLFADVAIQRGSCPVDPTLEEVGKKIVRKCNGLPLALKTLAGLLRFEENLDKWEDILRSDIWDLPKERSGILPALMLSYYYLPSHLKRCFAYCSIFPKNYEFKKEKLILLWMAEGFLHQPNAKKRMEDVGDEYFSELVRLSFYQPLTHLYERSIFEGGEFVMHDLMNDLARYVARGLCLQMENKDSYEIVEGTRHLSYNISAHGNSINMNATQANSLRTFLLLERRSWISIELNDLDALLQRSRQLRVLSLEGCVAKEVPASIGHMKTLRYLNLSHARLNKIPDSICTLYNLQTLILSNCKNLKELPMNMEVLTSLRHLDIDGTGIQEMALNVRKMKNLQTFTKFIVGTADGHKIRELGNFPFLQKLHIKLRNVNCVGEAAEADLKNKKYLCKLALEWHGETADTKLEREVLENLVPHVNLKELTITKYGGLRFPEWVGDCSFSNLVSLMLFGCENCPELPPLGQLQFLKYLYIRDLYGVQIVGSEFYGKITPEDKPFRSLKHLTFVNMSMWQEWCPPAGYSEELMALPCLSRLTIENCPNLTGALPCHLPCLSKLSLWSCEKLEMPVHEFNYPLLTVFEKCDDLVLKAFPLDCFPKLRRLNLKNCQRLEKLSISEGPLTSFQDLQIGSCPNLRFLPEQMHILLPSLTELEIWNCPELESSQMEVCLLSWKFFQSRVVRNSLLDVRSGI